MKTTKVTMEHSKAAEMVIDYDVPLKVESALQLDKLSRKGFAQIAATALSKVPSSAGLVVSVEGAWGSGKTSALAMIEALLRAEDQPPVIVHFNPWLVGEKDALLRHFLSRIAGAIQLSDPTRDGKKVAKAIKAYAKVFDLVKLIPGAEPWTSMIKSVVEAAGNATDAVAEYKTPDIEAYKDRVEAALRKFDRSIIVFIDDIDRLFPAEVFEMVRIIKSVGGLPRLGYVVAWDSVYVSSALDKLGVPQASSYLDKVVQVRMPLPNLSLSARGRLVDAALDGLDPEALRARFRNQEHRLGHLYYSGLRDLLDQPRDIVRVFNAVRMMEPLLRDEIVFADILGLAALLVKAPAVFELLRRMPHLFVGMKPDDLGGQEQNKDSVDIGGTKRNMAIEASGSARAVRGIVHFLFPGVASADGKISLGKGSYVEGCISHPAKLAIALQLSIADDDVSIKAARQYLQHPDRRHSVLAELTQETCDEFVDLIGELGESLGSEVVKDLPELCLAICRLIEQPLFVKRSASGRKAFGLRVEDKALRAVGLLINAIHKDSAASIAELIAKDPLALSCAAEVVSRSYLEGGGRFADGIKAPAASRTEVLAAFSGHVLHAAKAGTLLGSNAAGLILWTMARAVPQQCPDLFRVLRSADPTLDGFALCYFGGNWDSTKGPSYGLPRDTSLHEVYCPLPELRDHAAKRLKDGRLQNPGLAAWRSLVEGKHLYGVDGSEARH